MSDDALRAELAAGFGLDLATAARALSEHAYVFADKWDGIHTCVTPDDLEALRAALGLVAR